MSSSRPEVRWFEPGEFIDPDLWEECSDEQELPVVLMGFWTRLLYALIAIGFGFGMFYLLEANKRWQREKTKKPEEQTVDTTTRIKEDIAVETQTKVSDIANGAPMHPTAQRPQVEPFARAMAATLVHESVSLIGHQISAEKKAKKTVIDQVIEEIVSESHTEKERFKLDVISVQQTSRAVEVDHSVPDAGKALPDIPSLTQAETSAVSQKGCVAVSVGVSETGQHIGLTNATIPQSAATEHSMITSTIESVSGDIDQLHSVGSVVPNEMVTSTDSILAASWSSDPPDSPSTPSERVTQVIPPVPEKPLSPVAPTPPSDTVVSQTTTQVQISGSATEASEVSARLRSPKLQRKADITVQNGETTLAIDTDYEATEIALDSPNVGTAATLHVSTDSGFEPTAPSPSGQLEVQTEDALRHSTDSGIPTEPEPLKMPQALAQIDDESSESITVSDATPKTKTVRKYSEETAYVVGQFTQGAHSAEVDCVVVSPTVGASVSAHCVAGASDAARVRRDSKTNIDTFVVNDAGVQISRETIEQHYVAGDSAQMTDGVTKVEERFEQIVIRKSSDEVKQKREDVQLIIDTIEKEDKSAAENLVEKETIDQKERTSKSMKDQLEKLTGHGGQSFESATTTAEDIISMEMAPDQDFDKTIAPEPPSFAPKKKTKKVLTKQSSSTSSVLDVAGASDATDMLLRVKTLDDLALVMRKAGLESCNLIFGIDYTASNKYQGDISFGGRSLHSICENLLNPYQQVIRIMGKTLAQFATTGYIPVFGFGDVYTADWSVFPLNKDEYCRSLDEVLDLYNEVTAKVILSGPTNFAPLIYQAIDICQKMGDYHILVIVADGQVTNERATKRAIVDACNYALSIIVVGVGDGPWDMMRVFDESLPKRPWDNFHFVEFHELVKEAGPNAELKFAVNSLLEIPDQYKLIKQLGLM